MLIKVLKTCNASPNGIVINEYCKGIVYDMPDSMATVFIDQKWGKKVKPAPANKAIIPSENKGA